MDVPDGTYRVTVTVGDPAAAAGSQTINVESERAVERFVPTLSKPTRTKTVDVEVTDGRITIDPLYPTSGTGEADLGRGAPGARRRSASTTRPPTTEPTTEPLTTAPSTTTTRPHHDGALDHAAPDHAPAQRVAQPGRFRRWRQVPHLLGRRDQA